MSKEAAERGSKTSPSVSGVKRRPEGRYRRERGARCAGDENAPSQRFFVTDFSLVVKFAELPS
jgi:hypothetical protein